MNDYDNSDINQYMHCKKCLDELPSEVSPKEWSRMAVGRTDYGLQVWCNRHDSNIIHLDFSEAENLREIVNEGHCDCGSCD